ncbi:NAD(P)/FAD-dependent oxidoreductase [Glutamicibacter sp. MNS18]|uniref:flavin-containing monooxygenase n=1 Tax=Glutamicibacter sp. MNS18 TaxID=2989817 RepID=UPI00223569C6|nr:NAD(P)/FAD-dependent oxidoreductase [Glutamicibacter sp. MNS18]MCW4463985.1 NAD(P)/FAD-dependent oxidoreductase [Glutamicibacter sp. MNS18]
MIPANQPDPYPSGPSEIDTLIIGGGQAGLSCARQLQQKDCPCLVLEAAAHIGDQWRHQYDSLRLFTSNRVNGLPGMRFPGPPAGFASKDEVSDFLQAYADKHALPVQCATRVTAVCRHPSGFRVQSTAGEFLARNIIVATSPFGGRPALPAAADQLDQSILQLHSSQYRRPGQLRPGPVLVVGAGHSGCDIARELALSHPTFLCGRDTGEVPVPFDRQVVHLVIPLVMFSHAHLHTRRTSRGRAERLNVLAHGAPRLRVKRRDLLDAGVIWNEHRFDRVRHGQPVLADGTELSVSNVVWATGFRHDYSWLDLPVFDQRGWPREYRGVSTDVPGLYFCGLAYQYSMASMNFYGVGPDSRYIARRIAAGVRQQTGSRTIV